ncbi:MAG: hypothetical protein D6772_08965 [Bacteroidetes bacterium]|nr:MAG: hypothetical protein D6772_08965 [Bacteroidota bacterium]
MRLLSFFVALLLLVFLLPDCSGDPRLATTMNSRRKPLYDFFNDIRLAIAAEFPDHPRLPDFLEKTKTYLESQQAQDLYKLGGMYYEHNLNRQQGAYEYEDRFFENGCIIHIVLYPPEQEILWKNLQGYHKGSGKQIGQNFLFYQVFTAKPTDEAFETRIVEIINEQLATQAAALAQL